MKAVLISTIIFLSCKSLLLLYQMQNILIRTQNTQPHLNLHFLAIKNLFFVQKLHVLYLQKLNIWKMEVKQNNLTPKPSEGNLICNQFNLDISKLEQQSLLSNPTYRRLYNIVKNDMTRTDLSFRKHLIKELYFLLQITPVMDSTLREHFLIEVENMYNLNDHKKIHLASNKLNRLLNIVHNQKQTTNASKPERPKTGVQWNQNVSPFLRPYTATCRKQIGKKSTNRPQSSKFGPQSTKAQTVQEFCIKQFTTSIKEQLQISQDFIQKRRTNHHEYEPSYEQLYKILKKVQGITQEEQKEKQLRKTNKYPKSAFVRHPVQNWVSQGQPNKSHQAIADQPFQSQTSQKKISDSQTDEQSSEQQEYLYFKDDKQPKRPILKAVVLQKASENEQDCDRRLNKYHHIVDNKLVQAMKEDHEIAQRYVDYARVKSAMKRQLNRRTQSRRLMSAKPTASSTVKMHKVTLENDKENQFQGVSFIDLDKDPLNYKQKKLNQFPIYDKRQMLKNLYQQPLKQFQRRNLIGYSKSTDAKLYTPKRPLTSCTRFHSPAIFDPLSKENVAKYNAQALEQIQKIKSKVGGKCYASTQSLMKALVVQLPQKNQMPKWEQKSPFYGMLRMGADKKLKKRSGRMHSSKKKNNFTRK